MSACGCVTRRPPSSVPPQQQQFQAQLAQLSRQLDALRQLLIERGLTGKDGFTPAPPPRAPILPGEPVPGGGGPGGGIPGGGAPGGGVPGGGIPGGGIPGGGGPAPSTPNGYFTRDAHQVWPGRNPITVPAGHIHSTSGQDVRALDPKPYDTWKPVMWQWANEKTPGNIQNVTGPDGVPAYRFQVGKNDDPMNLASRAPRSEFDQVDPEAQRLGVSPQKDRMITGNTGERWYKFDVYLPEGQFPKDQRWATLMQWHTHNTYAGGMNGSGALSVHKGFLDFSKPFAPSEDPLYRMPLPTNDWTRIGMHVNWSSGKDGFLQWYVDGKPVGELYRGPTVPEGAMHYLKQGYYRDYGTAHSTGVVFQTPMMEAKERPRSL